MAKIFVYVVPAIVFFTLGLCEGLECYHCYSTAFSSGIEDKDSKFIPCNETNMTLSNTWVCPNPNSYCIYEEIEVESTKTRQIWRTCSNGITDPCDPNSLLPGLKMIDCTYCSTDKCNLKKKEENEKNNFTFNINANINLFIKQM